MYAVSVVAPRQSTSVDSTLLKATADWQSQSTERASRSQSFALARSGINEPRSQTDVRVLRDRERLIVENRPLAINIATKIHAKYPYISIEDLISAGVIGLIKAVDRHNPEEARLSTFAYRYIDGEIKREIRDKWQPVKIPREHYEARNKIKRLEEANLTDEQVAAELEITVDKLWSIRESLAAKAIAMPEDPKTAEEIVSHRIEDCINEFPDVHDDLDIVAIVSTLPPKTQQVFWTICRLQKTTVKAIAFELSITEPRARGYVGQLKKARLALKQGGKYGWVVPNFEKVVVEGIKKQMEQNIAVINFLDRLQKVVDLKQQAQKLESELVKEGGDRVRKLLATLESRQ